MNERQMQFRVGVVVFATVIIAVLLATLNSRIPTNWLPWSRASYRISIELTTAAGVGSGTPVRKNGLLIGRVESVEDLGDRILVHVKIDQGRQLYPHYKCQVRTTMMGDATIDFIATPDPALTSPPPQGRGAGIGSARPQSSV